MAAKGIAKTLGGEESKKTENDLLKLLKLQVFETNLAKEGKPITKQHLASVLIILLFESKDHFVSSVQF